MVGEVGGHGWGAVHPVIAARCNPEAQAQALVQITCHFACDTAHRIDAQGAPRVCGQGAPGGEVG